MLFRSYREETNNVVLKDGIVTIPKSRIREDNNNYFVDITLRNTSGQIAFFNQLQFLNSKMSPIRPSFYTDNFFSLMPGEKKTVTIETAKGKLKDGAVLALKGWNINKQEYKLK